MVVCNKGQGVEFTKTSARREVKWEEHYANYWPDEAALQKKLLDSGFTWNNQFHSDLSDRNLSLASRILIPPVEKLIKSKMGILFCHGYGGHLRGLSVNTFLRYADQYNCLVAGLEIEGHGLSERTHGLVTSVAKSVDEIHCFFKKVMADFPDVTNWFLHGESMGGCCVLLESLRLNEDQQIKSESIKGLILSAPMCKIAKEAQPSCLAKQLLLCGSCVCSTWAIVPSRLTDQDIFKRQDIIDRIKHDPLRFMQKPRLKTAHSLFNATIWLNQHLEMIRFPFLVMHGDQDVATTPEGSEELMLRTIQVKPEEKKFISVPGAMHGLFLSEPEEQMEKCWNDVFEWIDSRIHRDI